MSRHIDEALDVLSRRGEYRARSWSLLGTAMVASMQGRPNDAIDILTGVVEGGKEMGYRRMTQVALQFLGQAQLAAGKFDAADAVFLESLATSEQMGQVVEMAGMLARVAQVRAEIGKRDDAVEILASVLADPVSSGSLMVDAVPVSDLATELLAELEKSLDAETYAAAYARGSSQTLEVAAKELLATLSASIGLEKAPSS